MSDQENSDDEVQYEYQVRGQKPKKDKTAEKLEKMSSILDNLAKQSESKKRAPAKKRPAPRKVQEEAKQEAGPLQQVAEKVDHQQMIDKAVAHALAAQAAANKPAPRRIKVR